MVVQFDTKRERTTPCLFRVSRWTGSRSTILASGTTCSTMPGWRRSPPASAGSRVRSGWGDWNCLLFQDLPRKPHHALERGGRPIDLPAPSDYGNGQTRDREGRLIACSHHGRCLYRTEHDGRVTRLIDRHAGKRLNAPNDVIVKSDGTIWFTDPLYGISTITMGGAAGVEQPPPSTASTRDRRHPRRGRRFRRAERLAFSPTSGASTSQRPATRAGPIRASYIRVFDVGADGTLTGGDIFHKIAPGYCDGMKVDEDGNVWSSAADGVHCLSPQGASSARCECRTASRI